jgi:hypothetical protein
MDCSAAIATGSLVGKGALRASASISSTCAALVIFTGGVRIGEVIYRPREAKVAGRAAACVSSRVCVFKCPPAVRGQSSRSQYNSIPFPSGSLKQLALDRKMEDAGWRGHPITEGMTTVTQAVEMIAKHALPESTRPSRVGQSGFQRRSCSLCTLASRSRERECGYVICGVIKL